MFQIPGCFHCLNAMRGWLVCRVLIPAGPQADPACTQGWQHYACPRPDSWCAAAGVQRRCAGGRGRRGRTSPEAAVHGCKLLPQLQRRMKQAAAPGAGPGLQTPWQPAGRTQPAAPACNRGRAPLLKAGLLWPQHAGSLGMLALKSSSMQGSPAAHAATRTSD